MQRAASELRKREKVRLQVEASLVAVEKAAAAESSAAEPERSVLPAAPKCTPQAGEKRKPGRRSSQEVAQGLKTFISEKQLLLREYEAVSSAKQAAAEQEQRAVEQEQRAVEREQRARDVMEALQSERLAQRRVRLKLQGRFFHRKMGVARVQSFVEPPIALELPSGCRLLENAVAQWEIQGALPQLDQIFRSDRRVRPITAGQSDSRRAQVELPESELGIFTSFKRALEDAGEMHGRSLSEFNAIRSQPQCAKQHRHWDYDPTLVRYCNGQIRRRKPCSAILGLEMGARLYIFDTELAHDVTVLIAPGAILLFDGDVAHAGACYASPNIRVHGYFDKFCNSTR